MYKKNRSKCSGFFIGRETGMLPVRKKAVKGNHIFILFLKWKQLSSPFFLSEIRLKTPALSFHDPVQQFQNDGKSEKDNPTQSDPERELNLQVFE